MRRKSGGIGPDGVSGVVSLRVCRLGCANLNDEKCGNIGIRQFVGVGAGVATSFQVPCGDEFDSAVTGPEPVC